MRCGGLVVRRFGLVVRCGGLDLPLDPPVPGSNWLKIFQKVIDMFKFAKLIQIRSHQY